VYLVVFEHKITGRYSVNKNRPHWVDVRESSVWALRVPTYQLLEALDLKAELVIQFASADVCGNWNQCRRAETQ